MKILVLGSTGMLGSVIVKEFEKNSNYKIFATYQNDIKKEKLKNFTSNINFIKLNILDISDYRLKKILSDKDVIINCIAQTNTETINFKELDNAFRINSLFPHKICKLKRKKQKIYHITTDSVFNGIKGNYIETDPHNNSNSYSLTKSIGEVREENFFNIRCSIIGYELNSKKFLYNWFIKKKKNSLIYGFQNHIWNGLTTNVLSKIILTIIQKKIDLPNIIHLIPKDKITKYELLCYLKKISNKAIKIKKFNAKNSLNRSLSTIFKKKNSEIWNKTFKKKLTIREMINHI